MISEFQLSIMIKESKTNCAYRHTSFMFVGIDIERTVKDSIKLFNHTPPSIAARRCDNPSNRLRAPEEEKYVNLPVSLMLTQLNCLSGCRNFNLIFSCRCGSGNVHSKRKSTVQ